MQRYIKSIVVRRRGGFEVEMSVLDANDVQFQNIHIFGDYIYAVGTCNKTGSDDLLVVKFDKDFNNIEDFAYGGINSDLGYSITDDGTNLFVGGSFTESNGSDAGVLKLDTDLNVLDEIFFGDSNDDSCFYGLDVVGGDIYSSGRLNVSGDYYGSIVNINSTLDSIDSYTYPDTDSLDLKSYAHGETVVDGDFGFGAYSPNQDRIYFAPYGMGNKSTWYYLDCSSGSLVPYVHGQSGVVSNAYLGAVYSPNQDRIYFVPYSQSDQTNWHYIDCSDGSVNSYAHGATVSSTGYVGGAYSPNQDRIYFAPYSQTTNWHYIDCSDGSVNSYSAGSITTLAYQDAVYHENQDRIYFVPFGQGNQTLWHYIDCSDGSVNTYASGGSGVQYAYIGGAYDELNDKVYFIPFDQSDEANWHYIDSNGNLQTYAHGLTLSNEAYIRGAYLPFSKRIYMGPYEVSNESNWHYIDCTTGDVVSYAHGLGSLTNYAYGGIIWDEHSRGYFSPNAITDQSNWHFVEDFQKPTFYDSYHDGSTFYSVGNVLHAAIIGKTSDFSTWVTKKLLKTRVATNLKSVLKVDSNIFAFGNTDLNGNEQGLLTKWDSSLNLTIQYSIDDSTASYIKSSIYDSSTGYIYVCGTYENTPIETFVMVLDPSDLSIVSQKLIKNDTLDFIATGIETDGTNIYLSGYDNNDDGFVVEMSITILSGTLTSDADNYTVYDSTFSFSSTNFVEASGSTSFSTPTMDIYDNVKIFEYGDASETTWIDDTIFLNDDLYICGFTDEDGTDDLMVMKLDKTFNILASKKISIGSGNDRFRRLATDNTNIYVVGYGNSASVNNDLIFFKFDTDLNILDSEYLSSGSLDYNFGVTHDGTNLLAVGSNAGEQFVIKNPFDTASHVKNTVASNAYLFDCTNDGTNLYVAGHIYITSYAYYIAAYDIATMNKLSWSKINDASNIDQLTGICTDNSNIFAVGRRIGNGAIVKTNNMDFTSQDSSVMTIRELGGGGSDVFFSCEYLDGYIYVMGESDSEGTALDSGLLCKFDTDLNLIYQKIITSSDATSRIRLRGVGKIDNKLYLTGSSSSNRSGYYAGFGMIIEDDASYEFDNGEYCLFNSTLTYNTPTGFSTTDPSESQSGITFSVLSPSESIVSLTGELKIIGYYPTEPGLSKTDYTFS